MHPTPYLRISMSAAGLASMLGPLHADILALVWQAGSATAREAHRDLGQRHGCGYAAIRAAMRRLAGAGLLMRLDRRQGNAYIYAAGMSREELSIRLLHQILDGVLADHPQAVAAYLSRGSAPAAPRLRLVPGRAAEARACA